MTSQSPSSARPLSYLFYSPSVGGGFPRHSHYQASELAGRGAQVTMLCRPDFPVQPAPGTYRRMPRLIAVTGPGTWRKALRVLAAIANNWLLAWFVFRRRPDVVLLEANTEYFAPWWAWPHILLARTGRVTYLANFHDPVRHNRFGPDWWHRLSLFLALRPLSGGLIHGAVPPGADIPPWVRISQVPHGLFEETGAAPPAFDLRERLGIAPGAFVLLSFGLIGDRKNIDLLIDALAEVPEAVLVVAGEDVSATQRPASFYRDHAHRRGVADRVFFVTEYIPEDEVSAYFHAADAVALTYHRAFVSQSGVLQLAVVAAKPVLASSGPGPLREAVEGKLGLFVEPDSVPAIVAGLRRLIGGWTPPPGASAQYRDHASWAGNVDGLVALVDALRQERAR